MRIDNILTFHIKYSKNVYFMVLNKLIISATIITKDVDFCKKMTKTKELLHAPIKRFKKKQSVMHFRTRLEGDGL